jgi:hypothetical protein
MGGVPSVRQTWAPSACVERSTVGAQRGHEDLQQRGEDEAADDQGDEQLDEGRPPLGAQAAPQHVWFPEKALTASDWTVVPLASSLSIVAVPLFLPLA